MNKSKWSLKDSYHIRENNGGMHLALPRSCLWGQAQLCPLICSSDCNWSSDGFVNLADQDGLCTTRCFTSRLTGGQHRIFFLMPTRDLKETVVLIIYLKRQSIS